MRRLKRLRPQARRLAVAAVIGAGLMAGVSSGGVDVFIGSDTIPGDPVATCDLNATTANIGTQFTALSGGETLCLASGSYGNWSGGSKSSQVTVRPQDGATASIFLNFTGTVNHITIDGTSPDSTGALALDGMQVDSGTTNLTLQNATVTAYSEFRPDGTTCANILLNNLDFGEFTPGEFEGRLSISAVGTTQTCMQIENSTFHGAGDDTLVGCSDGIQYGAPGVEVGPGNEFYGINQGICNPSCPPDPCFHVDPIQPFGASASNIHDNYLHDNDQGIQMPDGPNPDFTIKNNVIRASSTCGNFGHMTGTTLVDHNVCLSLDTLTDNTYRFYGGNEGSNSTGVTATNNIGSVAFDACSPGCTSSNNLSASNVTFENGATPADRCSFKLAASSPNGLLGGTDSTDIGLNDC